MVGENIGAFNYCQVQVHIQLSLTADKSTQSVEHIKKMDVRLGNVDVLDISQVLPCMCVCIFDTHNHVLIFTSLLS